MIYDIVITTIYKDGQISTDESSIEAPSIAAAIVFVSDDLRDDPYEPTLKDEGNVTINAKAAINNIPAYQLQKAAVTVRGEYKMITDWDPIY